MAQTVGDYVISRLRAWGITRIYGYPGDGINGLLGALNRAQEQMRFVQVRTCGERPTGPGVSTSRRTSPTGGRRSRRGQ